MSARDGDRTGLAIILSLLALALFDMMGLIIKHLSPAYTAAELSAYRNLFGMVPSVAALWASKQWRQSGKSLRLRQWKLALFRGASVTFAQLAFYASLGLMAFATATTISYSMALFITAFAYPLLGERVGPLRWIAVLIGFAGVLMVTGLGRDAFSWAALLPVGAASLYALSAVTARMMDDDAPTPVVNLYSSVAALVGAFLLAAALGGFTPLRQASDLLWIFAMGSFGGVAVLCIVLAFRMTEQSNLAPFNYFGIPMAFVFGWLFFDEAPFGDLLPGALLIIAGGLMVVWRERRMARR